MIYTFFFHFLIFSNFRDVYQKDQKWEESYRNLRNEQKKELCENAQKKIPTDQWNIFFFCAVFMKFLGSIIKEGNEMNSNWNRIPTMYNVHRDRKNWTWTSFIYVQFSSVHESGSYFLSLKMIVSDLAHEKYELSYSKFRYINFSWILFRKH